MLSLIEYLLGVYPLLPGDLQPVEQKKGDLKESLDISDFLKIEAAPAVTHPTRLRPMRKKKHQSKSVSAPGIEILSQETKVESQRSRIYTSAASQPSVLITTGSASQPVVLIDQLKAYQLKNNKE